MSPYATRTVPVAVGLVQRLPGHPHGVAGAVLGLLHGQHGAGQQLLDVRADLLALVADDGDDPARLAAAATAFSTWPIMLRPAIGCSTFMVLDFIRVPPPAARTMTVIPLGVLTLPG